MKKNTDVYVTVYAGSKAPKCLEYNWIPTFGKRPFPIIRLYGSIGAVNNKKFKLPDFEYVN